MITCGAGMIGCCTGIGGGCGVAMGVGTAGGAGGTWKSRQAGPERCCCAEPSVMRVPQLKQKRAPSSLLEPHLGQNMLG
jgi:hypothetical protein